MHKSRYAAAAVIAAAALALTGCAGGNSGSDGGKTTIEWNMWAGDTAAQKNLEAQMAAAQKELGSDITIKLTSAPWDDFFTKLNTNLASGNVACVTAINGQRLSGYTSAFEELTDADLKKMGASRDDYTAGALAPMESGGKLYGLPYDTASMLVYYNADLFTQAGVALPTSDWTIDDFQKAAQQITEKTGVKGFAVSTDEFQWLSLPMAKSGLQPVDKDGKLDLTNPDFQKAASWYAGLASDLKVSDPVPSASDSSWTQTQFENGKAAMIVEGTWMLGTLAGDAVPFKSALVRIPAGDDGAYGVTLGSGYGITKACKDKDAALKVLGALTGTSAQAVVASQADLPARTASQPEFFSSLPEGQRDMVKEAFTSSFEGAVSQVVTKQWTQVSTAMPAELVSVYTGQETMENALKNLQQRFGG
jgi:multiple sugar transport system substrate-binding protein